MDVNSVLAALQALSSSNMSEHQAAEFQLYEWAQYPGLCAHLATVLATPAAPIGARQWAAVVLKDMIRDNWLGDDDDEADADASGALGSVEVGYDAQGNVMRTTTISANALASATLNDAHMSYMARFDALNPITVPEADKEIVRSLLPQLLGDPVLQIRTLAGNCIAAIAGFDYPDAWPGVLEGLAELVAARATPHVLHGAMRCLLLLAEDLADERICSVIPRLFPILLTVFAPEATATATPAVRAQALVVYVTCLTGLSYTEDAASKMFQTAYAGYLTPTLPQYLELAAAILAQPLPASAFAPALAACDPAAAALPLGAFPPGCDSAGGLSSATAAATMFAVRAAAVRVLTQLCAFFPKLVKPHMETLVAAVLNALTAAVPHYAEYVLFGDTMQVTDDASDAAEPHYGLTAFIRACLAFVTTITEDTRSAGYKLLRAALPQLAPSLSALLMTTASDCETFETDAGVFAEAEDGLGAGDGSEGAGHGEDGGAGGADDGALGGAGAGAGGLACVRNDTIALLNTIVDRWPVTAATAFFRAATGLAALGDAVAAATGNGAAVADAGSVACNWWKPREAATLLVGRLLEVFSRQTELSLDAVINSFVLQGINQPAPACVATAAQNSAAAGGLLLRARVAWLAGPLTEMLSAGVSAAVAAVAEGAAGPAAASAALATAAQGHGMLAQVCGLLGQCLADASARPHLRLSAARSVRPAGVAVGEVDAAVLASGLHAHLASLQGGAFDAWLPALCALAADPAVADAAGSGSSSLHTVLAAVAWACYAGAEWDAALLHTAAKQVDSAQGRFAAVSGVESAALFALRCDAAVTAHVATLPQGPVPAVQRHAAALAQTVLTAWQGCPMDHVVAEHVLDTVQALVRLPATAATIVPNVLPMLVPIVAADEADGVPVTVRMVALNLVSILLRSAAPAPQQADVLNVADNVPNASAALAAAAAAAVAAGGRLEDALRDPTAVAAAAARVPAFAPSTAATASGLVYSPATVLGSVLPATLQMGLHTDESHLVRGCVALTSTILALYGGHLRAAATGQPGAVIAPDAARGLVVDGAAKLLQRALILATDPAEVDVVVAAELDVGEDTERVSEMTLAPAGRLVTQLLTGTS